MAIPLLLFERVAGRYLGTVLFAGLRFRTAPGLAADQLAHFWAVLDCLVQPGGA